ncbi:unnamed protein product [Rhizoctonia solani]|uniref:Uncharacterized protein n=1 Tax=Rhizoctonia solani TaxID=456999 RepID=A0A8H3CB03_9AGAM|nr:unnamed protein product [Rhizoctonia solani]
MSGNLYTPFPFSVTPASPLFELSPISLNPNQGWAPSCFTPECVPTASWSTSSIGATLSFPFWGWDVALDGSIKGNMSIELLRDGKKAPWHPSTDTLFHFRGETTDGFYLHNITLKVLDSSPDGEFTVSQVRVNGSTTSSNLNFYENIWTIFSNDEKLVYSGFSERANINQPEPHITYISSSAGDTVVMQFNASAFLVYGPCGPTNGLMKITVDDRESTVNTSKSIASNDCLLFQSRGLSIGTMQELLIENISNATLGCGNFTAGLVRGRNNLGGFNGFLEAVTSGED